MIVAERAPALHAGHVITCLQVLAPIRGIVGIPGIETGGPTTTGTVSCNTTGFTSGRIPLYTVNTYRAGVDDYTDHRDTGVTRTGTSGRHMIPVMALSMTPSATAGCATHAVVAMGTGKPDVGTLDFDATTEEYAQFALPFDTSWNASTVTFKPIWSHPATTTNFDVVWGLQAVAVSNDDTLSVAFGTGQTSTDTGGTTDDNYDGPESSAITIAGTPAVGDLVCFRVYRKAADGADTLAVDARPGVDDLFRARCERVEEVPRKSPGRSFGARLLRYLQLIVSFARLWPVWVVDWSSSLFAERVRSVVRDFQPDLIQADFHVMGQYFSALDDRRIPRLLVQHEPGTRAAPYLRNLPSVLSSWVHRIEHLSWRRYEAGLYRQVDSIVVFTEADRDAIRKLAGQTPVSVIPPGNCIPEHPSDPLGSQPPSRLFIGNFIHPPNMDAARRLVRVIFPMVQERVPEICILGSCAMF